MGWIIIVCFDRKFFIRLEFEWYFFIWSSLLYLTNCAKLGLDLKGGEKKEV